ncbi:DNA-primase RepB domain-containing protein, partial [Burkholderia sp. SIMBA_045]
GKGRKAENVTGVRAIFVDLDGAPLGPVLRWELRPRIVVQSSLGRWHGYWKVSDCAPDQFRKLQERVAKRFGGDSKVIDLPRVMRLPGFYH